MNSKGKNSGGHYRSTHKIFNIDYSRTPEYPEGYLECLCGWIGRAWDAKPGDPNYNDKKHWPLHMKTAPPITETMDKQYAGRYGTTSQVKRKKKVAA